MNNSWQLWLRRSVIKHFQAWEELPMYIEGDMRQTDQWDSWFELRMDGPWYERLAGKDQWRLEFEINTLLVVNAKKNLYNIDTYSNTLAALMGQKIPIYSDEQASVFVECSVPVYDRRQRLQVNKMGIIEPGTNLEQATIECRHSIELEG